MRFTGSDSYVATPDLLLAVNAAIRLQRPLLMHRLLHLLPTHPLPSKSSLREGCPG